MTTASVTVIDVRYLANGAVHVKFSDGQTREFTNRQEAIDAADAVVTPDLARDIAIAHWIALTPDAASSTAIVGKTVEINAASVLSPVTIGVV